MKKWRGLFPPMVTPLTEGQVLDVEGTERMVSHLIQGGVDGIFLLGTTGEGPHVPYVVRRALVKKVCGIVAGQVPVLVGITETSQAEAVQFAAFCADAGASACVAAPPYYFQLQQMELVAYFTTLAESLPLPLFLYNMPAHTETMIQPDTVARLAAHPNIVGIKDSSANIAYFNHLKEAVRPFSEQFSLFMGPDEAAGETTLLGADGGVCSGANLFPSLFSQMIRAALCGDIQTVRKCQEKTTRASGLLYCIMPGQSSFLRGMKCALAEMGLIQNVLTPPFAPFEGGEREKVRHALASLQD